MGGVEPGISAMEIWFADVPHRQGFRVHEANRGDMENEPRPSSESPPTPAHFTAVPRKPRLIRQGKERRPKTAEPVPAQTVEIIRPFYANPNQAALKGKLDIGDRYAAPLPQLLCEAETLAAHVDAHLSKMGFWA